MRIRSVCFSAAIFGLFFLEPSTTRKTSSLRERRDENRDA
jgi:hypothetical protein